jgi:hypothetical protein
MSRDEKERERFFVKKLLKLENKQGFDIYKQQRCRIIVEKRRKLQNTYQCVFGTVEIVNDQSLYVTDTRGSWYQIPIKAIQGIHINEEQW